MLVYWLLFALPAWLALEQMLPARRYVTRWPAPWWGVFIALVLTIGLRHEVGADWIAYLAHLQHGSDASFDEALGGKDPAYALVNWVVAGLGGGIYAVNSVCAAIFSWGLVRFCRIQPRPWLALVVAIPYLVIVVAMGYTRQGTAIGLAMAGLVELAKGRTLRFLVMVALAASFHKSAVVLVPLTALMHSRHRLWTVAWVAVTGVVLFQALLQDSLEALAVNYLVREYESQGAGVRVAMNALPAAIFLLRRRHFALLPAQRAFWTWMAWGALTFIALLAVSPSSTAVDRVALYWIPLQLFVWSRLPNAVRTPNGANSGWTWIVVGYSAAVQFVWLVFSNYSSSWLPYRSLLSQSWASSL